MSVEETMELVRRADSAEARLAELGTWVTALVLMGQNSKGVVAVPKAVINKTPKFVVNIRRLKTGSVKFTVKPVEEE